MAKTSMIPAAAGIICTVFMVSMILAGQRSDHAYALFGLCLFGFSLLTPKPSPRLPLSAYIKAWLSSLFIPRDDIRKVGMLLGLVWLSNLMIWHIWPGDQVLQTVIDCSALFFLFYWGARSIGLLTAAMIGVAFARFLLGGGDYPYQVAINFLFIIQCVIAYWQLMRNFESRSVPSGKSQVVIFRESHGRRAA